jgi:hypothetical protein
MAHLNKLLLIAAALLVTTCAVQSARASEPPADLCSLLSAAEVSKTLGKTYAAPEKSVAPRPYANTAEGTDCNYPAKGSKLWFRAYVDPTPTATYPYIVFGQEGAITDLGILSYYGNMDMLTFFNLIQGTQDVIPGALAARQNALLILAGRNDCSSHFNDATAAFTEGSNSSAASIFASDIIRFGTEFPRPTIAAGTQEGTGTDTLINLNPNGQSFMSFPGTPPLPGIGPYAGGTPQAQSAILLHEFAHTINDIPGDANNVPLSMANTTSVLGNCGQQIK